MAIMSIKPVFFLLILTSFISFVPVHSQEKNVVIRVVQDDREVLGDFLTTIKLKKKQFKFQILLQHCDGVYVFASIRDSVYRFSENSTIQDFAYLKLLELRDDDIFNTNKELTLSETGWSYWFYNSNAEWYPFNRRVSWIDTDQVICTKIIKQLYSINEGKLIKLRDVKTPLYLFFLAVSEYDASGKPLKELMRRKVKIEWDGDDDGD